jgi:hypothetical protein
MAKTIIISYNSEPSVFTYKPIDRGVIYGKRKRVPLDEKGNECVKAALLDDGSLLIRSGMTAQGYFTSSGSWVPNSELEAVNPDGSKPELFPATIGESVVAKQIDPGEALLMRFASTYSLEPEELSPPNGEEFQKEIPDWFMKQLSINQKVGENLPIQMYTIGLTLGLRLMASDGLTRDSRTRIRTNLAMGKLISLCIVSWWDRE